MDSNTSGFLDDIQQPKMSTTLNVLTILTFIGSALLILGALFQFSTAKQNLDQSGDILKKMNSDEMPSFMKGFAPDPELYVRQMTQQYENRIPLLIISLLAGVLCIVGAVQMRKLKKQGFTYYLIGQILPFIGLAAFVGFFMFTGGGFYFSVGLTLLFIGLYATQRKNMVN